MTLETTTRAIRFALAVKDETENHDNGLSSNEIAEISRKLLKISKTVHRLDEYCCNYQETQQTEKASRKALDKTRELAARLGAEVYHQSDPRGWPLYLYWKSDLQQDQSINSVYSQVGIAVPPCY